jgi:hypothetical protein
VSFVAKSEIASWPVFGWISKKIGTELGIAWNKEISDEHTNDVCKAVQKLLKKIKTEFNGNTSQPKNKKLYEKAIQSNIFVPEKRTPSNVKANTKKINEPEEERQVEVLQNSIVYNETIKPNAEIVAISNETIQKRDVTEMIIQSQIITVSESVHTKITVTEGIKILTVLKNDNKYNKDITKLIIEYCNRCASDQLKIALKYISYSNKVDFLLDLIKQKYTSKKEEILGGSKLNKLFMDMDMEK